jgi:hypothetical protein
MRTRDFILLFYVLDILLLNGSIILSSVVENNGHFLSFFPLNTITIILNVGYTITYLIYIDDMQYLKADILTLLK